MPAAYCFGVLWLLVLLWVTHNCIVSLGSKEVQGNSLAIDTEVACAFAALFVAFLTFVVYRDRRLEARAHSMAARTGMPPVLEEPLLQLQPIGPSSGCDPRT